MGGKNTEKCCNKRTKKETNTVRLLLLPFRYKFAFRMTGRERGGKELGTFVVTEKFVTQARVLPIILHNTLSFKHLVTVFPRFQCLFAFIETKSFHLIDGKIKPLTNQIVNSTQGFFCYFSTCVETQVGFVCCYIGHVVLLHFFGGSYTWPFLCQSFHFGCRCGLFGRFQCCLLCPLTLNFSLKDWICSQPLF